MIQHGKAPVTRDAMISLSDNITVNPMTLLPKPNEFVFNKPEAWPFWKERFLRFGRLTVRQLEYSECDWIDLLCYMMGVQSEEIMKQIMPDVADKNLADVLQAFTDYFGRMENVGVSQDLSSIGAINCAVESSEAQQLPSDISNDSKSLDQESCKDKNCRKTRDLKIVGRPKSVRCAKKKDGQKSAEKDNKDCDMGHDQQTHSFADKVENTAAIYHLLFNWPRPGQLELGDTKDEVAQVRTVRKTMEQMMRDLKPQNCVESVNQIEAPKIKSRSVLPNLTALIYEKAINEPSFSIALALVCKKLAIKQIYSPNRKVGKEKGYVNFKELIITLCQTEFKKITVNQNARAIKMQEIKACVDPEKKKEVQRILTEDEKTIRMKSVGNVRFMGELFKQGLLTTNIMHRCIRHLLPHTNEESLECLCKLLSTIGKDLESQNQNLDEYFEQMLNIVNGKVPGKVSSKARFMLRDVIKLRTNKWVPRRDESNPKTRNQMHKEARTKRSYTQMNNTPLNTLRKDDRDNDRKRNPEFPVIRNRDRGFLKGMSQLNDKLASPDHDYVMKLRNKRLKH